MGTRVGGHISQLKIVQSPNCPDGSHLLPPRYINDPREALKEFNFSRTDTKWGAKAIMHMVEVSMYMGISQLHSVQKIVSLRYEILRSYFLFSPSLHLLRSTSTRIMTPYGRRRRTPTPRRAARPCPQRAACCARCETVGVRHK